MLIKRTHLENLIYNTGLNQMEFAEKVGVKHTTFCKRYTKKDKHLMYAIEYCIKLGVNELTGFHKDKFIRINIL